MMQFEAAIEAGADANARARTTDDFKRGIESHERAITRQGKRDFGQQIGRTGSARPLQKNKLLYGPLLSSPPLKSSTVKKWMFGESTSRAGIAWCWARRR